MKTRASDMAVATPAGFEPLIPRLVSDPEAKDEGLDKNSALEKIAKHIGMFVEKHEQDVIDPLEQLFREASGRSFRPNVEG